MPVPFSVIIPCFNAARWIEATLQSVLEQTVPQSEIEIIVVDDGSKDGSAERVRSMQLGNLQLIQTANHGVSHARNTGTAASSGEFIQYLDADDLLFPAALELRRKALIAHAADVAYGRYQRLVQQPDGKFAVGPVWGSSMAEISTDPELAAFSSFWVPPVALMYRRNIVKSIGSWNQTLRMVEDARFIQDAAYLNAQFVYVNEVLGAYRVHRNASLSKGNLVLFEQCILKNAWQTERRWRKNQLLTPARVDYLAASYKRSAEKLFNCDPVRFCLAFNAHRRLRQRGRVGYPDFCFATQACLGATAARTALKPVWFCVRGWRFLVRRWNQKTKPDCKTGSNSG